MRWPFRRRGAAPAPARPSAPSTPSTPDSPAGGRRAWQTLPPLTPVLARPSLTVGAPPVSGTRPLLHRPPALPPADRPAGTVIGLADVLPALDVARPAPAPSAPRPVRAVTLPAERPPLTAATPAYVGEPREPAQPHRAPAWLRALSSAPVMDPLLGAVMPAAPLSRPTPAPASSPAPVVPPRPAPAARRPLRPRGRVGLGAPLAAEPADPDPEPAPPAFPGTAELSATAGLSGTAELQDLPGPAPRPSPTSEAAPADLAREIAEAVGVGLDGVRVHRGPDVDRRAAESSAAAYAVDDAVHLPSAAGDAQEARALVAHELVHVAQQRRLGAALPDEAAPAGVALEAEAVAVEQAVRAGRPLPRLQHPRFVQASPPRIDSEPVRPEPAALPVSHDLSTNVDGQIGVLRQPGAGSRVPGRLQRRPALPGHAPAAPAPQAAPQPAAAPAEPVAKPAEKAAKADEKKDETPAERWSDFRHGLTSDLREMVFDSWRLDDPHETGGKGGGGNPGGTNSTGGDSREDRFNRLAQPALERLNEQRVAAGQSELVALPPEEEARIWAQVDAGSGGGGGGGGGRVGHDHQPAPIRNWTDFKSGFGHDVADMAGDWLGVEGSEVLSLWHHKTESANGPAKSEPAKNEPVTGQGSANAAHPEPHQQGHPEPHQQGQHADGQVEGHAEGHAAAEHRTIDTDDLDLDELSTRLYDRIRSRLRLELLLDRERAGLLSDFR